MTNKVKKETTKKAQEIKESKSLNDIQLCILFGISKPTLYRRKNKHDWSKAEIFYLNHLHVMCMNVQAEIVQA